MKNAFCDFKEAWWCPGGHFQTIFAALFRKTRNLPFTRHRVITPDQDFFYLDIYNPHPNAPCVLIFHGLASCASAPYVQSLVKFLTDQGWNAIAMNYRGCTEELNLKKSTYHSGKTEDLQTAIEWVRANVSTQQLHLVGFSIGGNMMLKWLGESGNKAREFVSRCVAVSVPYDLKASVELLDHGFNRHVYTRNLIKALKAKAKRKIKQFPDLVNERKLEVCETFAEFDDLMTAPLNGFLNAEDYWSRCSSQNFLESIACETLLLHADDDPFFKGAMLPLNRISSNQNLSLELTRGGGHLGFVSGTGLFGLEPWFEERIFGFLSKAKKN